MLALPFSSKHALAHQARAIVAGLAILCAQCLHAELPRARLTTIFPAGGKAGSAFEVTVSGQDLDHPARLIFSNEGITATPAKPDGTNAPPTGKFTLAINPDVAPGYYEARLLGRFGASNPRLFAVGNLSEITNTNLNHTPATALEISIDVTVNCRFEANNADYYRFRARKDERVLVRCQGTEIDSRAQATITVLDAAQNELGHGRRDGLIDFTARQEGDYFIKAHDLLYGGGEEYGYRLTLTRAPYIDAVIPSALEPGKKVRVTLLGRNLPGGFPRKDLTVDRQPLEAIEVEIEAPVGDRTDGQPLPDGRQLDPASFGVIGFLYRWKTTTGDSNPIFISYADQSVIPEQETNNLPVQAQKISPPCEVNGSFYPRGDLDGYQFAAKKGDVVWFEVFSDRLGHPTSPFLQIQKLTTSGKDGIKISDVQEAGGSDANIGGADLNTITRDPAVRFEAKEDGNYRIVLRDLFNQNRNDARLAYRLVARRETPDFQLIVTCPFPPSANRDARDLNVWTPLLRRGGSLPLKVIAQRRDNFKGEIRLQVEGLPDFVHQVETVLAPEQTTATIVLSADDQAENWNGPIRVIGKAKAGDQELKREARAGALLWNVANYDNDPVKSRLIGSLVLAVSGAEAEPVQIMPTGETSLATSVAGKLSVPLTLARHGNFTNAVKASIAGVAVLDGTKEVEFPAGTNDAKLEIDLTQQKLGAGNYQFYLLARASGKYRRATDADVEAAEETIKTTKELVKGIDEEIKPLREELRKSKAALYGAVEI
ncbi:MAG TPA: hypothetical protein VHH73_12665, partial [Verrucomicrobiae bacterium]|nr:hypothetical protein [Verrucomicrobiae bacterium]